MPENKTRLPESRIDTYRYLSGSSTKTASQLIDIAVEYSDQHEELYKIDLKTGLPTTDMPKQFDLTNLDKVDAKLLYIPKKTEGRIATAWDNDGTSYRLISSPSLSTVTKPTEENQPGSDISDNKGLTLNILSRVFRSIRLEDPQEQIKSITRETNKSENDRRQHRLKSTPDFSSDFDTAMQEAADWSENLEEFIELLRPDMMDGSDRNRTRLGRASMLLDESHEGDYGRGDITIYRALPRGESIEAGDWITLSEEYAHDHANYSLKGESGVTESLTVDGRDVYSHAGDPNEAIYIPSNTFSADIESIEDLWISLGQESKPKAYPSIDRMIEIKLNNRTGNELEI